MSQPLQSLKDDEILTNLSKEFHELVTSEEALRTAVGNFFDNIVGDLTLGVIFEVHRKVKTNVQDLLEPVADGDADDQSDITQELKKVQDCQCPICDRIVGCPRFAQHLANCMGSDSSRSRNLTRRVASSNGAKDRDGGSSGYISLVSDDEDDTDWNSSGNSGNKRGKKKKRNGTKKLKGTPKKSDSSSADVVEAVNEDGVGNEAQDTTVSSSSLIELSLFQANSNASSSPPPPKKKDRIKLKKTSKKGRCSPNSNNNSSLN